MHLFGLKEHNDQNDSPHTVGNPNAGATHHNTLQRNNHDYAYEQGGPGVGPGPGAGPGVGPGVGAGVGGGGGPGRFNDDGFNNNNNTHAHAHTAGGVGGPGGRFDEPINTSGGHGGHHANANLGPGGGGGAAHNNMGARTDAYGNPEHPGNASGGGKFSGKVESALGSVLGSNSLKQKGFEKQQESHALRAQAAELDVAEQHEQEALRRRERAVAHGAHPDHAHLGSHNPNRQDAGQGQGGFNNHGAGGPGMRDINDGPGRRGPTGGGGAY